MLKIKSWIDSVYLRCVGNGISRPAATHKLKILQKENIGGIQGIDIIFNFENFASVNGFSAIAVVD